MAGRSCIISARTWCPTASWSGWTTATRGCRRSTRCSASRPIRRCGTHFEGGRRISYGARALNEGGVAVDPEAELSRAALLIGDAAGFLNVPKIKGTHTAMKSGMLAAEAVAEALAGDAPAEVDRAIRTGCGRAGCGTSCQRVRNIRPAFAKWGMWGGLAYAGLDTYVFRGKAPWTLHHPHADNETLVEADTAPRDRLPEAGRRADLRPAVLGVHQQHQP